MKFRAIIALSVSLRKEISFKLAAARCSSFISDDDAAAYFIDAYLAPGFPFVSFSPATSQTPKPLPLRRECSFILDS